MIIQKRVLITILVGVFVLAGAMTPYVIQAAPAKDSGMAIQQIADTYGIDKDVMEKYLHQGIKPNELKRAAMLAKASGKTLPDVLAMKTLANTWQDVGVSLNVTKEQLRTLYQNMTAVRIEKNLAIPQKSTFDLLQQGYRAHDIIMANMLAQNTQKSVPDVMAMKKINNNWHDVAQTLGVNDETFKQDLKATWDSFPQRWTHRNESFGDMSSAIASDFDSVPDVDEIGDWDAVR
jgi:hypothetical protein